jgi:hypothetical protein
MVAPFSYYCLAPNQSFNPNRITLHNHVVVCSIISCNHRNPHRITVDCSKFRPQTLGDAIATLTNNKTKPTGRSCLGGFSFVENLSTH